MRPRRAPSRLASLTAGTASEVLAATARPLVDGSGAAFERALRTGAAVAAVPADWHWPRWLDRQLRPNHPAFVSAGEANAVENLTGRDWRHVGTVSSGCLAVVDPRGLVMPVGGGWSLDWLVGAEDRWHRPAHEAGVRQRLVGGAPVLETACRVPGGDIVHRVYGVTLGSDRGDALVIEVENQTAVPVALAFAVRPADLLGAGSIVDLSLDDTSVLVDGRPVIAFDRVPARSAAGDASHDSLSVVVAGEAPDEAFAPARDALGLANASFVMPLTHRTSIRLLLVHDAERRERIAFVEGLPAADVVANGWSSHADRAALVELPDARLNRFWSEAVRNLLLASGGGTIATPLGRDRWTVADEARVVHALHLAGLRDTAGAVLRRRCDEFELDGWFRREDPSLARNAAIFQAVGDAWSLAHDRDTVDAILGPTVKAAHWSERHRSRNAARISVHEAYQGRDSLRALAVALDGVGQPEAAQDVAAFAARFVLDHDEPAARVAPASDPLVPSRRGIDCLASVEHSLALALAGDEAAFASIAWLAEVAADRGRWPSYVHPRLGTGSGGAGDDPVVAAAIVELVRALIAHVDVENRTLALLPVVPDSWYGQNIDVRDLPTELGRCSFAVRWHGARPALLWELAQPMVHEGAVEGAADGSTAAGQPVTITMPGLDPSFRTTERTGETLLAAPSAPAASTTPDEVPPQASSESSGPIDPGASFS